MGWIILLVVIIVLALIVGISAISSYNKFVSQRNVIQESWRQIDVELKRRHDLIPQLVETVKGYARHEQNVLSQLTALRTRAVAQPGASPAERGQTERQISQALRSVMVSVEAYPELKSNTNFVELQRQLSETEDRIAAGRRFYNANVRAYNTRLESFPSSQIAKMGHFDPADYFTLDDPGERDMPVVDFSNLSGAQQTSATQPGQSANQQDPAALPQTGQPAFEPPPAAPTAEPQYQPRPDQQAQPGQQGDSGQQSEPGRQNGPAH